VVGSCGQSNEPFGSTKGENKVIPLLNYHAMKAYHVHNYVPCHEDIWGSRSITRHILNFSSRMEVSGQFHATPALPPKKEPLVCIGKEAGWALEPVWTQ
jgi:hypothetical protein